jgi:hypothetical protein
MAILLPRGIGKVYETRLFPDADSASVQDGPYPPAPEPTAADREALVLDPYDSDLADLLALARAARSENTAAMAILLTSGSAGGMLVAAAKLLAELSTDAAMVEPDEMIQRAQDEAALRELAGDDGTDIGSRLRRFDAEFAAYAARIVARP